MSKKEFSFLIALLIFFSVVLFSIFGTKINWAFFWFGAWLSQFIATVWSKDDVR